MQNCIISSQPNTNINITNINSNIFVVLGKIMFIEWVETGPLTVCLKDSKFYKQTVDLLTKLTTNSGFTNKTYLAGLHAIAQIGVWEPPGLLMCPFSSPAYEKKILMTALKPDTLHNIKQNTNTSGFQCGKKMDMQSNYNTLIPTQNTIHLCRGFQPVVYYKLRDIEFLIYSPRFKPHLL